MNNFFYFSKPNVKEKIMKKKIICFMLIFVSICLLISTNAKTVFADDGFDAKAYILVDYSSGEVLLKNNEKEHLEIASMVKLMTSLLTLEKIDAGELNLDQKLMVSEHAASQEGSQAFLDAGKEYSVDELLKSVIIASANDSSVVLSEAIGGSEEGFVNMMNAKAKELGLNNTLYANATGLPSDKEQYSCAEDVAKLLKKEMEHKLYFKYSNVWIDEIIHESGRRTELVNTNVLIRKYQGVDIGKTGFTDEAGYCLSCSCKKNDMRLISVVIGTKSTKERFSITTNLLNFGFANFESKKVLNKTDVLDKVFVKGASEKLVDAEYENDFVLTVKKGEKADIKTKVEIQENLKAPIKKGDKIGKVFVVKDGLVVGEVNIVAKQDVKKATFGDAIKKVFDNFRV